jgi:hypothetical protein
MLEGNNLIKITCCLGLVKKRQDFSLFLRRIALRLSYREKDNL